MDVDLNGDGFDELIHDIGEQGVHVFWGRTLPSETPDVTLIYQTGPEPQPALFVRSAGDLNGDGYEDVVITNDLDNNHFGSLAVFGGNHYIRTSPIWVEDGSPGGLLVGIRHAAGLGDVDGDGLDDLAVGCQHGSNLRGRVVIFSGDSSLIVPADEYDPIPFDFAMSIYPNPANGIINIAFEGSSYHGGDLNIYNLLGQQVAEVTLPSGAASVGYDVSALATGIYLVHAEIESKTITQKLIVLK